MNKIVFAILSLVVISIFLVGCAKESDKVDVVDEKGNIVGEAFKYAPGKYKLPPKEVPKPEKLTIDPKTLLIIKSIPDSYCADHFVKIESSDMGPCGGPENSYGCRADQNYPPPASSCPAGMQMNNVYGYAAGSTPSYSCYIPQKLEATSPPVGCPLDTTKISCAYGFVPELVTNQYTKKKLWEWYGPGWGWGCSFTCKAEPDPYVSNPNWPCVKAGYKPIGGGGGDTCCFKK